MLQNREIERTIGRLLESHGIGLFRALPVEDMPEFRTRVMKRARTYNKESEARQWLERITRPQALHPWVRSVLLFGCNTNDQFAQPDHAPETPYGRVGRWLIYLSTLQAVAQDVISVLEAAGYRGLSLGDHHYPLRPAAVRAGFARFRRNNFVFHEKLGSWVGWWQVLTDAEFDYGPLVDEIWAEDICGTCPGYCIESCGSRALFAPYTFDSERCVRVWNLAPVEIVPVAVREGFSNWILGCDACQEACPFNQKAQVSSRPDFARTPASSDGVLMLLGQRNYVQLIPILERKPGADEDTQRVDMLRRNAAIVLGATRDARGIPALVSALHDQSVTVRAHAARALGRLGEKVAVKEALAVEQNPAVRQEIKGAVGDE